jgi:hypothetical protein
MKLTTAVPAVVPAATLTPVGEPGAVPSVPPHADRKIPKASARRIAEALIVLLVERVR